jgi:hypothetical protein
LLRSPDLLQKASAAYHQRWYDKAAVAPPPPPPQEEEEDTLLGPEPRLLEFGENMTDAYDLEIPLRWDARSVSLSKGKAETKSHEVRQQIRFSVNYPNGKGRDLYSAKLMKKKDGIIFSEPITVRHCRDPKLISKWTNVAAVVKDEAEKLNLSRDTSVKAQAVNIMDRPVKKILYRFPDGMRATNKFFKGNNQGLPPADECALIKWPLEGFHRS